MSNRKRSEPEIEKLTGDKFSSASRIKDLFERLKEKEKQESFTSDEFQYESRLYNFDHGLAKKLQQKYEGVKLEDHFAGNEVKNDLGQCYLIVDQLKVNIKCADSDKIKKKFLSELRIVNGIGEFYEEKLQREGYKTVNDLLKHHRFCFHAKEFIEILSQGNGHKLVQYLEQRYPKSHELVFLSSSFYSMEDFIFIDIESLGLHGYPIFLIGIAYFKNLHLQIEQLLARDMNEEAAVLVYLNERTHEKKVICSFNGKSFDIPVIKDRMSYYGIKYNLTHPHYDIFHFSKRAFKDQFYNCQLTTLESALFKVKRKVHIPSFLIPNYYRDYLRSKNIGTLVPIIKHNKQDIISTVQIFGKLHELWG